MMLTLRQLQHFAVLIEEGSYTRAARQVHLTQSALTRSIQSLEEALDLSLLDRAVGGISLSQPGRALRDRMERILTEVEALKRDAVVLRNHGSGVVRFGAGVFPAAAFLQPLLKQLAADYPGICVRVEIESWHRLLEKLDREELDFVVAITHSLPPSSSYQTRGLPRQVAGLFVRDEHPLLATSHAALQERLSNYGLAATDLPPRARQHLASVYGLTRVEQLPISLECNNIDALRDVVLSSDTVLFATRDSIRSDLAAGRLIQLPVKYFSNAELDCNIIHRANFSLAPAVETVIGLIQDIMPLSPKLWTMAD